MDDVLMLVTMGASYCAVANTTTAVTPNALLGTLPAEHATLHNYAMLADGLLLSP